MSKAGRADRIIAFIERYLRVPEGEHVGKPIKLADFQIEFIRAVYGNKAGTRRAYLSLPRKNGKTGLIAALLLAHVVGPEAAQNSQVVSGARSRDQAALVWNLAAKMCELSPEIRPLVRIIPSGKRIVGLAKNVEYRALAADGATAHGLSPVLAILDEVGQVRGPQDDFVDAITTSQGAHKAPLLIAISTQAPSDADLFSVWLDDAKLSKDPRIVSRVHSAPEGCDLMDESAWKAANPALGIFRSLEDLREQATQAKRMPSAEATFRVYGLNQRVEARSPFVTETAWKQNGSPPAEYAGERCYWGLDLSAAVDLTALVRVWFSNGKWNVLPTFWTPENGLADRSKRDRAPYDVWARSGQMIATPGSAVDYDFVAREMLDNAETMDVAAIAFDRWRIEQLKAALVRQGAGDDFLELLKPFGQGFVSIAPALDALEKEILNGTLAHGNHPVLAMCAGKAVVIKDPAGNRKLDKAKSTGRIDGMVALTMAIGIAATEPAEQTHSGEFTFV